MSMRVVIDEDELRRVRNNLGTLEHKAPNVIASALNRSVTNIKSNVPKEVRKNYNVKANDIKETLKVFKASQSKLTAGVVSKGKTLGLDKFKVNPKTVNPKRKTQLKIAVKKSGAKQILGAFIASINGTKVFKRDGRKRLPISRLMGPSVPQMLGNDSVVENINKEAYLTYEKRINHDVNRLLSKNGG